MLYIFHIFYIDCLKDPFKPEAVAAHAMPIGCSSSAGEKAKMRDRAAEKADLPIT